MSVASQPAEIIAGLLAWYETVGLRDFAGEVPRDRFAETAPLRAAASATPAVRAAEAAAPQPVDRRPSPSAEPPAAPVRPALAFESDDAAADDARARARRAKTLEELEATLREFEGCALRASARSLVFASGRPDARLMMVGEAPGRDEDLMGEPFTGRSGQLLNRMLAAIGLERDAVRITNTVFWRPPGNRTPTPAETETCLPFTLRHIELVRPRVLICLGSPSAKALLHIEEGIMRARGRWSSLRLADGTEIPAMAMLHPAYLLRQPAHKRLAWRDLLALKAKLDETGA
ncbi:uracil-DNA glycosylase family protein [Aureimonas sp. AU4]|uniref:uracil-DNA glycosylase n=1 Tax=Aureimonas sp. AU4 TaxID=1638163 RepID=UPI000785F3CE|nr:uracil-DNA glycosylase [Aureimonas sp. AU4]